MDQKHAMLYPEIHAENSARNLEQRNTASAAMGLPVEAPPSYDFAISAANAAHGSGNNMSGWAAASAPENLGTPVHFERATNPPVIVEQPTITIQQLPQQPHIQPHIQPQQPPQQQAQSQQIHIPTVVTPPKLGPNPCAVLCPVCGAHKVTRMTHTPSNRTHLCAFILCLVGWCFCACTVPYCMNSCRNGNHYCSQCNTFLGTYRARRHK